MGMSRGRTSLKAILDELEVTIDIEIQPITYRISLL